MEIRCQKEEQGDDWNFQNLWTSKDNLRRTISLELLSHWSSKSREIHKIATDKESFNF